MYHYTALSVHSDTPVRPAQHHRQIWFGDSEACVSFPADAAEAIGSIDRVIESLAELRARAALELDERVAVAS